MARLASPIPGAAFSNDGFGERAPIVTPGGTSGSFHYGQDFDVPAWTPIRAAADGRVTVAGRVGTYGYAVYLDHGDGLVTRYAHMIAHPPVAVNWYVAQGDVIGYVGSTGASTGNHLHFEVLLRGTRVDPIPYLTQAGAAPAAPPKRKRKPMAACVATQTGNTNLVRIFDLATGEEHVFESPDRSYIENVALTYGVAPDVPVSYITRGHFDKIATELADTRARRKAHA